MYPINAKNSWHYSIDVNESINFCIWILMIDGLHVSPFDQHPQGRGFLQELGLGAESWQAWFEEVIKRHTALQNMPTGTPLEQRAWAIRVIETHDPVTAWNGNKQVGKRLAFLWRQYQPIANHWKYQTSHMFPPRQKPKEMRRLWNELKRFHDRLPTMSIYFVDYPVSVLYLLPPITAVFGTGLMLDSATYSYYVMQAAEELAAMAVS